MAQLDIEFPKEKHENGKLHAWPIQKLATRDQMLETFLEVSLMILISKKEASERPLKQPL